MAGAPKAFESPKQLLDLFKEYKEWTKETPFLWHDYTGKDAEEVWKQRQRPITWMGFEGWLCERDIAYHLGNYEQNRNGAYEEFLPVIRAIKKQCTADVVSGAMSGIYNANIAARVEGLKEQTDINLNDNRKQVGDLFPLDETDNQS